MRRAAILPLLLVLAGCERPAPATRGGIVSTNPCADQILVSLVEPERIAAISHYSQDPAATSLPPEVARRYRVTAGTAEEVIALRPDLVVTRSEEHTSELQSLMRISYAVFCLKKKKQSCKQL